MPTFLSSWRAPLTYLSGWPRRVAALLCLLMALFTAASHGKPVRRDSTVSIVVSTRALAAGTLLNPPDLALAGWPAGAVPAGIARAITAVLGHRVATSVNRGMPVTAADLLEPAIAGALASGCTATTVELAAASELTILHAGNHVDLYPSADAGQLTDTQPAATDAPIARSAEVLSVLPASAASPDARAALVVATDRSTAARLAARNSAPFVATLVQPP
jgi:Flp pilus assembly protein CpaB